MILEPKKRKSVTVSIVSPSICHEVMGLDAMINVFKVCLYIYTLYMCVHVYLIYVYILLYLLYIYKNAIYIYLPAIFLKEGTAYEASWPEIRACRIEIAEHLLKKSLFLF